MDCNSEIYIGKGTQAPNIKDKYCVCHLVGLLCEALDEI